MAKFCYDLHIENDTSDNDSSLVLMRFPAMRSQLENPPDQIQLGIKPKSMKLKMEVAIDSGSSSYCREKALALANRSTPKSFATGYVDKNVYTSSRVPVDDGQLFVCKIVNNKLVCRPVSSLLTMRSDFSHFDLKEEVDPKEEVKPVSVKFAGPERQNAPPAKILDPTQSTDDSATEYQPIVYKSVVSREAENQRIALFGQSLPKVKPDPDAGEQEDRKAALHPLPDIKPKVERMDIDDIYSNNSSSNAQGSPRKSFSVKQRVKECLLKAKIVNFEEIYYYIKGSYNNGSTMDIIQLNNKDILDALSEFAILVQGNWAIKSETLHGDSSERDCTDVTGISVNLYNAARDYLLWMFTQNRIVSRLEYSRCVRMPDHDVLELLNQLAAYRADIRRWELKLPTDERFLEQFPDIVQRQATFWKVRKANKLSIFGK